MKANLLKGYVMDYQERQAIAIENANNLQHTANCFQEEMIKEMKTNNRVTSFHSTVMIVLTAAIVFLGVITLLTNRNKPGRYAISGSTNAGLVIDTKTSRLWLRTAAVTVDLGTNENPIEGKPIRAKKFGEDDPSDSIEDLLDRIAEEANKE
jgi:hypothetical protein